MRNSRLFIALSLLLVIASGCRKKLQSPSWDTDLLVPLVKTRLDINNIADSLYTVDTADGSITLAYDNPIYTLGDDELLSLPDTTILKTSNLISGLNVNPGQPLVISTESTKFGAKGAELREANLFRGTLSLEILTTITEPTELTISIPGATLNGVPFSKTEQVPAATAGQTLSHIVSYDFKDYKLDLRGQNQNDVNTIYYDTKAILSPNANPYVVKSSDKVDLKITFKNLDPYYVVGYFGQNNVSIGPESTGFQFLKKVVSGKLDLDQVRIWLEFENGIGADASLTLNQLESYNSNTKNIVALNHSIIGKQVNLNRAVRTFSTPPVTPSYYKVYLDNLNSNVDLFLENLPTALTYKLEGTINPLGNVSNGNDFFYRNSLLKVNLKTEIPLHLSTTDLVLLDTIPFEFNDPQLDNVNRGKFTLYADNYYPFTANLELELLDSNKNYITNLVDSGLIDPGFTNAQNEVIGVTSSKIEVPVTKQNLEEIRHAGYIVMRARLNTVDTPNHITLFDYYYLKMKVVGDFNYRTSFN